MKDVILQSILLSEICRYIDLRSILLKILAYDNTIQWKIDLIFRMLLVSPRIIRLIGTKL
jgi:hypothetical protein